MFKPAHALVVLGLLLSPLSEADIQVGLGFPGVNIGINLPSYPYLVPIPGYPVYYAPQVQANFFFYDGLYWVYQYDTWYAANWYNGPWWPVNPDQVPLYILRVPVQYYLQPPSYFLGWQPYAAPHWGERFGRDWEMQRRGWDRWDRHTTPAPAPLPAYQQQYSRDRYPQQWQQQQLQQQHYRYQPHDPEVQQAIQPPERHGDRQPGPQGQPQQNVMPQQGPQGYRQPGMRAMPVPPEGKGPRDGAPGREQQRDREQPRGHEQEQHRSD